jgi:hypothetical protein
MYLIAIVKLMMYFHLLFDKRAIKEYNYYSVVFIFFGHDTLMIFTYSHVTAECYSSWLSTFCVDNTSLHII